MCCCCRYWILLRYSLIYVCQIVYWEASCIDIFWCGYNVEAVVQNAAKWVGGDGKQRTFDVIQGRRIRWWCSGVFYIDTERNITRQVRLKSFSSLLEVSFHLTNKCHEFGHLWSCLITYTHNSLYEPVIAGYVNCLVSLVSRMTYYVWSGTLTLSPLSSHSIGSPEPELPDTTLFLTF